MVLEMGGKLAEQGASITVRAWGSPNGEGLVVSPTWLSICWKVGRWVGRPLAQSRDSDRRAGWASSAVTGQLSDLLGGRHGWRRCRSWGEA